MREEARVVVGSLPVTTYSMKEKEEGGWRREGGMQGRGRKVDAVDKWQREIKHSQD